MMRHVYPIYVLFPIQFAHFMISVVNFFLQKTLYYFSNKTFDIFYMISPSVMPDRQ